MKHADRQEYLYLHAHKHFLSTSHTITHTQPLSFLSATLSLSPSRGLASAGIRSFYRASACWRGRRYGRAVSPSSDWISDQYPVPRQPASSGWTDCVGKKSVLVVSRLVSLIKEVWWLLAQQHMPVEGTPFLSHVLFVN